MIVSKARSFIFFHNPKVAGTAFRSVIQRYHDHHRTFWGVVKDPFLGINIDLAHLRGWELPIVAPDLLADFDHYRKIVFVRCPERRFMSACFEHFKIYEAGVGLEKKSADDQRAIIMQFINEILTINKVVSDARYVYFSPQRWYVETPQRRMVDFVLPLSGGFDAAFDVLGLPRMPVGSENTRRGHRFEDIICAEISEFVRSFYAADYDMITGIHDKRVLLD
jgi:hypothetical protein